MDLMRQAYALLPRVKITDLLIEVDSWCDFTRHFLHLKSEEPPKNKVLVLTAVLADAINLGVTRMADACPGISPSKLGRINTLYIRDETYTKARAQIVNYHHELAFAANFGQGTTSSSDAQRFRAARIRDLADKRLYSIEKAGIYPTIEPLIGARLEPRCCETIRRAGFG